MGAYLPLVSVAVEHDFFVTGQCQGLVFVPTPSSAIALDKMGLLTRTTPHSLRVFYDVALTERLQRYMALPEAPVQLAFHVFSRDPFFTHYTEPAVYQEDAILYFANRTTAPDTPGTSRLHAEEHVSAADFIHLDDPLLADMLRPQDRLVRPLFLLNMALHTAPSASQEPTPPRRRTRRSTTLPAPPQSQGNAIGVGLGAPLDRPIIAQSYTVRFKARQTFWKYYLCGDLAREGLAITDLNQHLAFVATGQETLANNRVAVTFRSTTPIPWQEKSDCRLQLREEGTGNGKVLMRRLPVASVQQLGRDIIGGEQALVAEVFIHG